MSFLQTENTQTGLLDDFERQLMAVQDRLPRQVKTKQYTADDLDEARETHRMLETSDWIIAKEEEREELAELLGESFNDGSIVSVTYHASGNRDNETRGQLKTIKGRVVKVIDNRPKGGCVSFAIEGRVKGKKQFAQPYLFLMESVAIW